MVKIQFYKDYSWGNLPGTRVRRVLALDVAIGRLALMRSEWQEIAYIEGKPLEELHASVELLLSDVCDLLELLPSEREFVFGLEQAEVVQ